MTNKNKYFLVLVILLLFLSISVVSASDNTTINKTTQSLSKTTPQAMEKVVASTEEKNIQNETIKSNKKINKEINKKNTTNIKTTATTINASDYNTLRNALTVLQGPDYDDVTINIQNNITLDGSTTVNIAIKKLTINGNQHTINGNQKQFLKIQSGTIANINNIIITNCTAVNGGVI